MLKNKDTVVISLSEDILKVAQIKGTGPSAKLAKTVVSDVKGISENDLPKTISSSLKGFSAKSANVAYVLPSSMITTKNIEVPSVNREEIKSIVALQASRHTPFSREEIQSGYVDIGVIKQNFSKVLLIIANKQVIQKRLTIFEKAGVKVKRVLFAPEGVASFYQKLGNIGVDTPTAIIDIDKQSTDVVIISKGKPIASRNIPIGLADLIAEKVMATDQLVEELKVTLESYKTEDIDKLPTKFILSQDNEQTKGLLSALKEKLSWDVQISSYIDLSKAGKGVLNVPADASLLDVVSCSLMVDAAQVNLMPEEVELKKSIEVQGREVVTSGVLGLIVLLLLGSILLVKLYFNSEALNQLKKNYDQTNQEALHLQDISNKTTILREYLQTRMISLDVINEIYKNIPNEIYLTNITMDEEGSVNVQGVSDIASLIYKLGTTLKSSKLFKSVEIQSTTAKKDRGKDVSAFEIVVKLKPSDDDAKAKDKSKNEESETENKGEKS